MRDAEDVAADIDRALTSELDSDWPTAIALIEADRREAKLEALREIRVVAARGNNMGCAATVEAINRMIAELENPSAIRSGAEPDAE